MKTPEQKLLEMEIILKQYQQQIAELARRVAFLERENQRRKNDVIAIANRRG